LRVADLICVADGIEVVIGNRDKRNTSRGQRSRLSRSWILVASVILRPKSL